MIPMFLFCLIISMMWGYILGNLIWYIYEFHLDGKNFLTELGKSVCGFIKNIIRFMTKVGAKRNGD